LRHGAEAVEDLAHAIGKVFHIKGFLNEFGAFRDNALVYDYVFRIAGHKERFHSSALCFEPGEELNAIHFGHDDVGQQQVDGAWMSSIIPKRTYLNICRNSTLNIIHAEGVKSPIGFM